MLAMPMGPLQRLNDLVTTGRLEPDPAQLVVARALDELSRRLERWRPGPGLLARLRANGTAAPNGLYIHGGVGGGKTMLMDLFFEGVRFSPRRRVHFHEFMAEVHELIAVARAAVDGDPIPSVARRIARQARLLCFDELHVTDIADAMILGRLFRGLFESQVVVVCTSNVPPSGLYQNGLNRQLFLPFLDLIGERMTVLELAAAKDFRLAKLAGRDLYFTPLDATAANRMREVFARLTGQKTGTGLELPVHGRKLLVPEAAMGVALFRFSDLCEKPLGAADFLRIAYTFHTVLIEGVPRLTPARRNEARRFVNLVDTLYDNRVCLIVSADAEPHELYPVGDGARLFERTASRLLEMRSAAYLASRLDRMPSSAGRLATGAGIQPTDASAARR
ncbi:MAG TPA: cell division protein ZapE [Hyphomicrobiaceae bacterium]|nr:cell division protein ZapE [Hyphomicrobiaceae bacterium]